MTLVTFISAFIVLLMIGIPVAIALGGAAVIYLLLTPGMSLTLLIQTTYAGIASFPLLAIPLFMLAGALMSEVGITADLVRFTRMVFGRVRGGLGLAAILASALFAAISGSAVATVVAIGAVMIPAMKEAKYDAEVAASVGAAASCMGPIIPPSIPFIIYGVLANVSIGALFLAGIIPGALLGIALMAYMVIVAKRRGYPKEAPVKASDLIKSALRAIPALLMPVIILGGILGGVFTPTESGGVAVTYAVIVGALYYRRLKLKRLPAILLSAGIDTAIVMLLLGLSEPFAWVIAVEQVPQRLLEVMTAASSSPIVMLLLINVALLILGIPLETAPALTIVTPVIAPLAPSLGIDPIHLGVVVCFNLVLGLITPPVGAVLFSTCGISGISLERLSKGIWPPFLISLGVLLLVPFVPWVSTFLPRLLLN